MIRASIAMPCCFVQPAVIAAIAAHAPEPDVRASALQTALAMQGLRDRRAERLAPMPGEPEVGEVREIQDAGGRQAESGRIVRVEDQAPTADDAVNGIYDGMGNALAYFARVHGWRGVDGRGGKITAIAHYGPPEGRGIDNAAWTGEVYICGDGTYFRALWRDVTVSIHELMHAVNQHARNIGPYRGEPGCLMEATSDIGALVGEQFLYGQDVTQATWVIGTELCRDKVARGKEHPERPAGLRDALYPGDAFDDPVLGRDSQPRDMDGFDPQADVHVGSSIPTRAFALGAIERGGRSWEHVGLVWWDVLVNRAPANPTFQDWAALTLQSANDRFGAGSLESQAIVAGWRGVKIDATATPPPAPAPAPDSPCWPEFLALFRDPMALPHLQGLARLDSVRRLAARVIPRRRSH